MINSRQVCSLTDFIVKSSADSAGKIPNKKKPRILEKKARKFSITYLKTISKKRVHALLFILLSPFLVKEKGKSF